MTATGSPSKLVLYLELMRVRDYAKNVLIYAPLFFGLAVTRLVPLVRTTTVFFAFCLVASSVYIFNDIIDREMDKLHPGKQGRSLASGAISIREAAVIAVLLLIAGIGVSYYCEPSVIVYIALYLVLNAAYTLRFKQIAVLDVIVIALGFVIRLFIGAVTAEVRLYPWLVVVTFYLALFLALSKRRTDLVALSEGREEPRAPLSGYSVRMLDYSLVLIMSVVSVVYTIYTLSPDVMARMHSDKLYVTVPIVLFGMLRYLQLIYLDSHRSSPTEVFWNDRAIQLSVLAWIGVFACLIYGN